ncbi:MAG: DUF1501 domain-containing protein [Planctomycetes bacterium]|nr:DUF1501 domain-containing protein [Planctomycetota bacterium]
MVPHPYQSLNRRDVLKAGFLGVAGLTLADVLRLRAASSSHEQSRPKSVIMIYLPGGPSHMDMYDMKPNSPAEYRGDFNPIQTNVPGIQVCEHMPRHAKLADKFSIVRGLVTQGTHDPYQLLTGARSEASGRNASSPRPAFGCVVSRLREPGALPQYVSLGNHRLLNSYDDPETPAYLGAAHRPFSTGPNAASLNLVTGVTSEALTDRRALLGQFDSLRRDIDDARGNIRGMDRFSQQALDMVTSPRAREAFDLQREPQAVRDAFGIYPEFLMARRLVEAGVSVVSLASRFPVRVPEANDPGGWDTHAHNFSLLKAKLPRYDFAISALLSDLWQRGLYDDVAVVIWGEFGRTPKIGDVTPNGRGHWPASNFAILAGGGMKMGHIVGETDARGERPRIKPYSPQNVLATLYRVMGISLDTTLNDHSGRPQFLLDAPSPIAELL